MFGESKLANALLVPSLISTGPLKVAVPWKVGNKVFALPSPRFRTSASMLFILLLSRDMNYYTIIYRYYFYGNVYI
jgi:hypothetical protein